MPKINVLGQSYTTRNPAVHSDVCLNYYPEKLTKEDNSLIPQQVPSCVLYPTPGTIKRGQGGVGASPVRGMISYNGFIYAVIGNNFYKFTQGGSNSLTPGGSLGTVSGSGPVSIISNGNLGNQLMICTGSSTKYSYTIGGAFVTATDPSNIATSQATYQQGYGVFVQAGTNQFWITDLENFANINALNFASAYTKPDPLVAAATLKQYILLFGQSGTEIWQNTGLVTIAGLATTFPYTNVTGSYLEQGLAAPFGICLSVNTLYWVTRNERGGGQIARVGGGGLVILTPEIVSTRPIEELLLRMSTISDCISYAYQDGGHEFVVFTFPTGNATIVYDVTENAWHQRSSTGTSNIGRHVGNCYANLNGVHYVGDYQTGNIYEMTRNALTDIGTTNTNGTTIYREIQSQHFSSDNKRQNVTRLEADIMTLVSVAGTTSGNVTLYTSKDGGNNFTTQATLPFGYSSSSYERRVFWTLLGRSRNWIFKLVVTSAIDHVIMSVIADTSVADI